MTHVPCESNLQYRHLIPAPVDRMSVSAWLYKHPWISCQRISQTHWWRTKLVNQSYVQLWGHPGIHTQKTGWQSGMRSCIMPGLPANLVQELNVGTVRSVVRSSMRQCPGTGWQSGVWWFIVRGLSTHFVQEVMSALYALTKGTQAHSNISLIWYVYQVYI